MENKSIKNILKNFFFSFFRALFVSMVFLNICGLFLLSAGGFSSAEKALILNVNLWRIVFIFGLLFVLTAGYFFIRKKEELSIPIFLFVFSFFLYPLEKDQYDSHSMALLKYQLQVI